MDAGAPRLIRTVDMTSTCQVTHVRDTRLVLIDLAIWLSVTTCEALSRPPSRPPTHQRSAQAAGSERDRRNRCNARMTQRQGRSGTSKTDG